MARRVSIPEGWEAATEWVNKHLDESEKPQKGVASDCQVSTQRISQVKQPKKPKDLPSVELMWRLRSSLCERDEGFERYDDGLIRLALVRLIQTIGPARILYLNEIGEQESGVLIDKHELKASSRRRLRNR